MLQKNDCTDPDLTDVPQAPSPAGSKRRVVIFTSNPRVLEDTWGSIIRASANVEAILLCVQVSNLGLRDLARRFRKNIAKHGLIFVFYRAWATVAEREPRLPAANRRGLHAVPVETIAAQSIHSEDVLERIRSWAPDIGLSIGAPILRQALFTIPRHGTLNIHCGQVPTFRGAPPAFWELVTGAAQIGATFHRIDQGLDTGAIIDRAAVPVYTADTLRILSQRAFELGHTVFERGLTRVLADPRCDGVPQESGGTTYRQPLVTARIRLGLRINFRRFRTLLSARHLAKNFSGAAILLIVRPIRDAWRTISGHHPVRIFTYHRVTNLCRDGMTVSPEQFADQVHYLAKHHDIVSLDSALSRLSSGKRLRRPLGVLTFDDAYRSVYAQAAPIMRARGIVGTCFAATGLLGTNSRYPHDAECDAREFADVMSWQELAALRLDGWTVGSHTVDHARLADCDQAALEYQLACSKASLESEFGSSPMALAYPFGGPSDISEQALLTIRRLGYDACLSNFGGENFPGADRHSLKRIDIGANHTRLMWKLYAHGFDLAKVRARYSELRSSR